MGAAFRRLVTPNDDGTKGTPSESRGRKATGLRATPKPAGLPYLHLGRM